MFRRACRLVTPRFVYRRCFVLVQEPEPEDASCRTVHDWRKTFSYEVPSSLRATSRLVRPPLKGTATTKTTTKNQHQHQNKHHHRSQPSLPVGPVKRLLPKPRERNSMRRYRDARVREAIVMLRSRL
eukprot:Pompholyxophrys_punicea_v1_NODE_110_length_3422_cov_27.309177.p6 type:complete len:127 gc:universal NODE_110_length_3422_cov_27.309177:2793-2413(-)